MIIYKVTNKINGHVYIGKTIQGLIDRKNKHISDALNNRFEKIYFYRAIKKYGKNSFKWEVIHKTNNKLHLNELEKFYIKFYRTKGKVYNMTDGGEGLSGLKFTEEHKKKIGDAQRGEKNHMWGKEISPETKIKLSKSLKGRICKRSIGVYKHSKETKNKLSKIHLGHIVTEETKLKISESLKGNIPWNKGKKVDIIPWNKGKKMSKEYCRKISEVKKGKPNLKLRGRKLSEETKKKISISEKGKKLSEEQIQGLKIRMTGKNNPMYGKKRPDLSERNKKRGKV